MAKCLLEILLNQRSHLLGRTVVGVVVAGGKCVGAEDYPALYLWTEARLPSCRHNALNCRVALWGNSQAKAHRVKPCKVARCLGWKDQVVGSNGVLEAWAVNLNDLDTLSCELCDGVVKALLYTCLEPV